MTCLPVFVHDVSWLWNVALAKENVADRFKDGTGESSQFWKQLNEGLTIMEEDFKIIDVDKSGFPDPQPPFS